MICVDNSDYTRNGDYAPSRFACQTDAVNLVCGAKTRQNPENSVGILATAGDRIEVRITPTTDLGRMLAELPNINIGGCSDLLRGIQTAQLALKHRQNKNQKQRIIAFVGSPVSSTEKELETLGKNLKKNNVSLDIVSFGEVESNAPKLDKLLSAVNSNDSSHIVDVPVGPRLLSDVLLSSVIINPDGEGMTGSGTGGGFGFDVDPGDDPELALALRISMEEERARQAAASGDSSTGEAGGAAPAADGQAPTPAAPAPAAGTAPAPVASDAAMMEAMGMEDMDDELRQALLLSMQDFGGSGEAEATPAPESKPAEEPQAALPTPPAAGTSAEAAPAAAAPATAAAPSEGSAAAGGEQVDTKWLQDPSFVQELLGSLPGVDISDPRIQSALKDIADDKKPEGEGSGSGSGSGSGGGDGDKKPPQ